MVKNLRQNMSPTVLYLVLGIRCSISIKNKKSNQDIEIKFHEEKRRAASGGMNGRITDVVIL